MRKNRPWKKKILVSPFFFFGKKKQKNPQDTDVSTYSKYMTMEWKWDEFISGCKASALQKTFSVSRKKLPVKCQQWSVF